MAHYSVKKARKPRGKKLNGQASYDLCPHCLAYHCDPITMSPAFNAKVSQRSAQGVCRSCGHHPCRCRSTCKLPLRSS